jgi:hypothetical protein
MQPLKSVSELTNAIDQAVFEFEELSICVEEDLEDELYDYAEEFRNMAKSLQSLQNRLEGESDFSDVRGLDFMQRARQLRPIIPFFSLVELVDAACRNGVKESCVDVG